VAKAAGLGFLPLRQEIFDFVVPKQRWQRSSVQVFVALLADPAFREELKQLGFSIGETNPLDNSQVAP
jgi:putative molybdopterin biosynthesis protein